MLSVGIVVVSYGSADFLVGCFSSLLASVAAYGPDRVRIALVENHQDPAQVERSRRAVEPFLGQGVQFWPSPSNLGYGGGANYGWSRLDGEVKIVLNPDMRFPVAWLTAFVRPFEQNQEIGIVGCKLLDSEGRIQHAGGLVRRDLVLAEHFGTGEPDDGRWDASCPVEFVTGAALGIRQPLFEQTGGFDPAFFPGYFEDVDLCRRVRSLGYEVWYEGQAVAVHFEGGAFGRGLNYYQTLHRNRLRYVFKHLSTRQLLTQTLPAETRRQHRTMDDRDRQATATVYRTAARSYFGVLSGGAPALSQEKEKKVVLKKKEPPAPPDVYDTSLEDAFAGSAAVSRQIMERVSEVKSGWLVEEKPFRSRLPLVASLRERFNSISTRWYVKPILAQQVEYNAAVARAIEDLGKQVAASVPSHDLEVAVLSERMLALESRLERIENLLEKLADSNSKKES